MKRLLNAGHHNVMFGRLPSIGMLPPQQFSESHIMNLKLWFEKMFEDNKTDEGLVHVRNTGKNDGVAMTNAYADGFLEGVGEVLHSRLNGFHHVIETTSTQRPDVRKITAKRK